MLPPQAMTTNPLPVRVVVEKESSPMAEDAHSNSIDTNDLPRQVKRRRVATAAAGSPSAQITEVKAPKQPATFAHHNNSVVSDAPPLNLRARRLAQSQATQISAETSKEGSIFSEELNSAPSIKESAEVVANPDLSSEPETREPENGEPENGELENDELADSELETGEEETAERESTAQESAAQESSANAPLAPDFEPETSPVTKPADSDSKPFSDGGDIFSHSIADDLQALALANKDTAKAEPQPVMSTTDFASMLFRAPTVEDEPVVPIPTFEAVSTDLTFGAPDLEAVRELKRQARERQEAEEDEQSEEESDASSLETEETEADADAPRKRRRRGGRGRRGRGKWEESEEIDAEPQGEEEDEDEDEDQEFASLRRRRRRRRLAGATDDSSLPDDPPNTVVKLRQSRDEVRAVKGSTRLEAKKQRRKEGRDSSRRRYSITESEFLARRESVKRSMIVRERPGRTQIVVLEDNVLVEHYVAQKTQTSLVGNVYLGKVQNVLPSMEAAFVDIGKGRNAVLYAGEVNWDAAGLDGQPRRIELALKPGDSVLVQVTKDPIGHKGARLTSQISLPGRYLVYVPGGSMTGISRKLPDRERSRLKKILKNIIPPEAGVIVRTAAEGASEEELTADVQRLQRQWEKIEKASSAKNAPAALSQEPDLAIKVVRDIFNEDFTSLIVEGNQVYQELHEYISQVAPDLLERVTKHVGTRDSFAKYKVDEQLMKAMDRKVYLPSGGSLVIDRTEAMTVVDVNTGKFTGSGGTLEETVTRNNLEAAEEIVRQLRLRDIGGIIVIDFIDMVLESNRDLVLRRMIECLSRDRTKHQVAEVTSLGLVQMTRKRVGAGLIETFSTTCESCNGRGIQIDLDGQHHHEPPAFENPEDSARKNRRRKTNKAPDRLHDDEESDSDVLRLEEDEAAKAQRRATIASIAAASSHSDEIHS